MSTTTQTAVVVSGESLPGSPVPGSLLDTYGLWQVVVCDRQGNELADLTSIAYNLQVSKGLNRPSSAACRIPSWHAYATTLHSDGDPYVEVGVRTLKVRRRDTPSSSWQIEHNGIVWHIEDEGDA